MGTVHLRGEGGVVWEFDEPLPEWVHGQLERGVLHPADESSDDTADTGDLDALRAEYEQVTGEKPDQRKKAATLRKEIDAHNQQG